MQRPTETRWLSHQSAVNALRRCLKSAMLTLKQDAAEGNAIALGLSLQMSKPKFVATLLLLSDILSILGNLSGVFQVAKLNLLNVDDILQDSLSALEYVKKDPLQSGYMMNLGTTLQDIDISHPLLPKDLVGEARTYIDALISNIKDRFPQART